MLKICVKALSEPIKYLFNLLTFLILSREIPKTVYSRLQFGPFGRSYWGAFYFLTIFVPRVLSRVSSYHVRSNYQIKSIYPFSR
ncbi:hypothetical protein KSS87_019826 [Heliosperma pusillum]|nr:hypothetical protein KSS87_019826 [Heliosperma pusillum]